MRSKASERKRKSKAGSRKSKEKKVSWPFLFLAENPAGSGHPGNIFISGNHPNTPSYSESLSFLYSRWRIRWIYSRFFLSKSAFPILLAGSGLAAGLFWTSPAGPLERAQRPNIPHTHSWSNIKDGIHGQKVFWVSLSRKKKPANLRRENVKNFMPKESGNPGPLLLLWYLAKSQ